MMQLHKLIFSNFKKTALGACKPTNNLFSSILICFLSFCCLVFGLFYFVNLPYYLVAVVIHWFSML